MHRPLPLLVCKITRVCVRRHVGKSVYASTLGFPNPKGRNYEGPDLPLREWINGFRDIIYHTKLYFKEWAQEYADTFIAPVQIQHNDVFLQFQFKDPATMDKFQVSADSENKMGYSTAFFERTNSGTVLFHGNLDTRVVDTGVFSQAGFAAFKSRQKFKAFFRMASYTEWNAFTHVIMKIRGDGRVYMVTLGCPGFFDYEWADVYSYPLYTHGGPYWQYVKIPFSKFILAVEGRVQTCQEPVRKTKDKLDVVHNISSIGVTLCDKITGPFQMEIDWIGVCKDYTHFEEFAYEEYKLPIAVL